MGIFRYEKTLFYGCLSVIALLMLSFHLSSFVPKDIEFFMQDMDVNRGEPLTVIYKNGDEDSLYWMNFKVSPRWLPLDRAIMRTRGCLSNLSVNDQPIPLQDRNWNLLCDNSKGIRLKNMSGIFSKESSWTVDGSAPSSSFGVTIEKDWSEPVLIFAVGLLTLCLIVALYLKLPLANPDWRLFFAAVLGIGFIARFWAVFINQTPELGIWSDMGGYMYRAIEMARGEYNEHQLFQPIGFTLWSKWLREAGGWELFNWGQVFLSWGTSVLVTVLALKYFARRVAVIALLVAAFHLGWIGTGQFHMAEMLYTFLMTVSLFVGLRMIKGQKWADFFVLGLLTMLGFYVKGTHSFFVPLFSIWWLYKNRRQFSKAFVQLSVMAVGCLVVAIPHMAWTAKHYGKPYFGPTAGALNFVEGKCPSKNNADSTGASWMSPLFSVTGENEWKQWDRPFTDQPYFWKEGMKCIQQNPWVMVSSVRFVYYLFYDNMPWPLGVLSTSHAIDVWSKLFSYLFIPFSLLGFLVLLRTRSPFAVFTGLYVLALFLTVYIFKSELRFRMPFDGIFILWGSYGLVWFYEKLRQEVPLKSPLVFNDLPSHVGQRTAQFHSVQARVDEDLDF